MKVDTMRRIDYWIGIPLCFITSIIFKLLAQIKRRVNTVHNADANNKFSNSDPIDTIDKKSKPRVLILALSEMGSIVLAEPALKYLAQNNELHFITFQRSKAVLELLNLIPDTNIRCIDITSPQRFIIDSWQCLIWARSRQLHWVIDFELFSRYSALLSAYSGAKHQVGFSLFETEGLYRGDLLSHKVAYNSHIHISKNFLSLAKAVENCNPEPQHLPLNKFPISDTQIRLHKRHIPDSDIQVMQQQIQNYFSDYSRGDFHIIIINSQGGDLLPMRNWGQASFLQLSQNLLENYQQVLLLMTGSPEEYVPIQQLVQELNHSRCINFAGAIELPQILALYQLSELMVSNDSGPNHFAALVDLHTYTLFGPETPRLYGSLGKTTNIYKKLACSPCVSAANHRKTPCVDNQCMQQISVSEVYALIASHLNQKGIH